MSWIFAMAVFDLLCIWPKVGTYLLDDGWLRKKGYGYLSNLAHSSFSSMLMSKARKERMKPPDYTTLQHIYLQPWTPPFSYEAHTEDVGQQTIN